MVTVACGASFEKTHDSRTKARLKKMKIREPPAGSGWRPGFYGPGNSPSVMQISSGVRSGSCNISSSAAFSR